MVIYLDEKDLKAIYFDNEGHVIHYKVEPGPDSVRFLNEQYRLTYRKMRATSSRWTSNRSAGKGVF